MAAAIVDYGRSHSIEPKPEKVTEFENFPGEGIHGKIDDRDIYIGNRKIVIRTGSETGKCFTLLGVKFQFKSKWSLTWIYITSHINILLSLYTIDHPYAL